MTAYTNPSNSSWWVTCDMWVMENHIQPTDVINALGPMHLGKPFDCSCIYYSPMHLGKPFDCSCIYYRTQLLYHSTIYIYTNIYIYIYQYIYIYHSTIYISISIYIYIYILYMTPKLASLP